MWIKDSSPRQIRAACKAFPLTWLITAQEVGSYKPDLQNFEYMVQEINQVIARL